jgi:NAD(P)-dependent dehydrogenase (short-subunit alcohol dehydrogenase family)
VPQAPRGPLHSCPSVRHCRRQQLANDVASSIVRLADPASDWLAGQVIAVDRGLELT